jgi:hypothetical protein
MNEIDYSQLDPSIRGLVEWANANGFDTAFSCSGVDEDHEGDYYEGEFYLTLKAHPELVHRVVDASFAFGCDKRASQAATSPAEALLYFHDGRSYLKLTVTDFADATDAEHCIKSLLIASSPKQPIEQF